MITFVFFPDFKGKDFNLSPFKFDVSCEFFIGTFIRLRNFPSISDFVKCFYGEIISGLSNVFSMFIKIILTVLH